MSREPPAALRGLSPRRGSVSLVKLVKKFKLPEATEFPILAALGRGNAEVTSNVLAMLHGTSSTGMECISWSKSKVTFNTSPNINTDIHT